jgi:myo-inositol-1(or 4)-monophosphatase
VPPIAERARFALSSRVPHDPLLLATAIEAVLRAGDLQMAQFGAVTRVSKKGAIDLVTDVDLRVEEMFRGLIAERFPDHAILAEERAGTELVPPGARYRWIFDPIDGTTNFAHGLPIFCATVALEIDGRVELGAVYDPTRRELFTAERGGGAFLNGAPLRVSEADCLLDALLCTGFPYDVHETLDEVVGLFGRFVARARGVRRLGSAALDLCYVAAGRLDGFWEQRLHPWDVAAGVLLVEEAGGRVTDFAGGPFRLDGGEVVASNGRIHDEMVAVVRDFVQVRAACRQG